MIIESGCKWVEAKLRQDTPFFTMRYNDGEHKMMFKALPDGTRVSDNTNIYHSHGEILTSILVEISESSPADILLGCSWHSDTNDELNQRFERLITDLGMRDRFNWANGHWPLEGVVDKTIIGLITYLAWKLRSPTVLITHEGLEPARHCIRAQYIEVPFGNSWQAQNKVYRQARWYARRRATFVCAAGYGVKPALWNLYREFPGCSVIDVGHLFDGVFGIEERGWLKDKSGPWYKPYMEEFAPYVRSFI